MANEQNLIPVRTQSEAREKGQKGGIASGEARRAKKTMAQLAELMLNSKLSEDKKEEIQSQFGDIIDDDATVASMMVAGQIKSAISGNTKAFNALTELSDKAKASNKADKYELPARVLGKSFVDINRQIKPNIEYVFESHCFLNSSINLLIMCSILITWAEVSSFLLRMSLELLAVSSILSIMELIISVTRFMFSTNWIFEVSTSPMD